MRISFKITKAAALKKSFLTIGFFFLPICDGSVENILWLLSWLIFTWNWVSFLHFCWLIRVKNSTSQFRRRVRAFTKRCRCILMFVFFHFLLQMFCRLWKHSELPVGRKFLLVLNKTWRIRLKPTWFDKCLFSFTTTLSPMCHLQWCIYYLTSALRGQCVN